MDDCLSDYILVRGITRNQLTQTCKLAPSTLTRLLHRETDPHSGTVRKLADALNLREDAVRRLLKAEYHALQEDPCRRALRLAIAHCHALASETATDSPDLIARRLSSMIAAAQAARKRVEASMSAEQHLDGIRNVPKLKVLRRDGTPNTKMAKSKSA